MTHQIATLLHFLAANCTVGGYFRIHEKPELCAAMPEAIELRLVESPGNNLDRYWLRLTPLGQKLADESLAVMRAMIGGTGA